MIWEEKICEFAEMHHMETIELLKTLAAIPAPSHHEEKRAEFIRSWLMNQGAANVQIDEAGNVLFLFSSREKKQNGDETDITVIMAHMDVVFPDTEALPVVEKDGKLFAPGIGDNTANVVNLLMTIKFLLQHPQEFDRTILFVANVGEEGLGNLKGSREIMKNYGGRIKKWISFDLYYDGICNSAVGSQRYKIKVKTKGGHSYSDFGEDNAIAKISEIIGDLYQQKVPEEAKTTYNVGEISGGTSINTIAPEAVMTYEFRSESLICLKKMEESFKQIIGRHCGNGAKVETEILGIRPGRGKVNEQEQERLVQSCLTVMKKYYDGDIIIESASTDSNIPLSEGIPAVTVGTVMGALLHTRQEWIFIDSMRTGQKIAIGIVMECLHGAEIHHVTEK